MPIFQPPRPGVVGHSTVAERAAIDRHVRELDRLAEDLALLDREIAQDAIHDSAVNRLMTITGVNLAVAAGIVAAIGDISGCGSPDWEPPIRATSARSAAVTRA